MMKLINLLLVSAAVQVVLGSVSMAQEIVDEWRYTLRRPAAGWRSSEFNDSDWTIGSGGFGTRDTPGSRVGTVCATNNIWLRKSIKLSEVPARPVLLMHHDEDVEVYVNGIVVAQLKGFTNEYTVFEIPPQNRDALKAGANIMAVHCRQSIGGQFIDVHIVDGDSVPELHPAKRDSRPFISDLITTWGAEVSADNAWTEYPRPLMTRERWQNLNGSWDYAVTPVAATEVPATWDGTILVPYCLESKLGGVQRLLDATEALWYRRSFDVRFSTSERLLLNFEAVDYRCEVFVNGKSVGKHVGGNTPFSFDVSEAAVVGQNELVVRVEDETEKWQLRGKQTLNTSGIWYTQVSGIWQTVWLETVPRIHISDVKIATNAANGTITVAPVIAGADSATASPQKFRVLISDGENRDGKNIVAQTVSTESAITLTVPGAKLWSPDSPHLYDIEVQLISESKKTLDKVSSYAGIRSVGKVKDADGHWRFTLNGKTIFHWGPLDQGWWPDGLLTPPSDEAMVFDIEWLKSAGFNMIRKHIKVEPRRYYYHCDRLGMMVWQDQVSAGNNPPWTRLQPSPKDAEWPDAQHKQFMVELERMISLLESHACITVWVPFNEAWGQHRTQQVGEWTVKRDPSLLINVASGGNFWPVGDVVDEHSYPDPAFPFDLGKNGRFDGYIKVMGEFGGHGWPVAGHLWDVNRRNWGYGDLPKNPVEYRQRYEKSLSLLNDLRRQGIAAGVYTQTTDVEGEINGLMTYDRKVIKIPAAELSRLHKSLHSN